MSKQLFDLMAEKGRAALDDDSVYSVYLILDPKSKQLADQMAEKGRAALDDDSVYSVYQNFLDDRTKKAQALREKAYSDYAEETKPSTLESWSKFFMPRTTDLILDEGVNSSILQNPFGKDNLKLMTSQGLDIGSLPGRVIGSVVAGGATGAGSVFGGSTLGDAVARSGADAYDFGSTKGSDKDEGFLQSIPENLVKDPLGPLAFAIPAGAASNIAGKIIPQLGKFGSKIRPVVAPAIEGAIQGTQNLVAGLGERFVDPKQEGSAAMDAGLSFALGSVGNAGGRFLEGLGDTKIGRELLRKFTPSEKLANAQGRLLNQINEGFGVDVSNPKNPKEIDPQKLGAWLSEMSRKELASDPLTGRFDTKTERIPRMIDVLRESYGSSIGDISKQASDFRQVPLNIEGIPNMPQGTVNQLDQSRSLLNIINELERSYRPLQTNSENEVLGQGQKIFSPKEFESAKEDILSRLPRDEKGNLIGNLTADQIRQYKDYLFKQSNMNTPGYSTTKEDIALDLRGKLDDEYTNLIRKIYPNNPEYLKLNPKFSTMAQLDLLANKSPYFSSDRPEFMMRGIPASVRSVTTDLIPVIAEKPIVQKSAKQILQSQIRADDRKVDNRDKGYLTEERSALSDADTRILGRAYEALRFNPNDKDAIAIIRSYSGAK